MPYKQGVIGSSPVAPTTRNRWYNRVLAVFLLYCMSHKGVIRANFVQPCTILQGTIGGPSHNLKYRLGLFRF